MRNAVVKTLAGLCAVTLLLALAGCDGSNRAANARAAGAAGKSPADTTSPGGATGPAAPKIPGEDENELTVRAKPMVTATAVSDEPVYTAQDKLPSGTLKGLCYIPYDAMVKDPQPPKREKWDFKGGADKDGGVKDALPGELDYCENLNISKPSAWPWYLGEKQRAGYGVIGGAVFIRDIKAGPAGQLSRPGFTAAYGQITCQRVGGYGLTNIGFAPPGEKVLFGSVDSYPCHFVFTETATGRAVYDGIADPYQKLTDPSEKDVARGGRPDPRAFRPKLLQTDPIREPGGYVITCKRHPWQRAYLFVVDNPYVAELGSGREGGLFTIGGVPAGKHRLDVWHPAYKPVQATIEFEIKPSEVTEILIPFEPPAPLAKTKGP